MSNKKTDLSMGYKVCRYFSPSALTASQTTQEKKLQGRKRPMKEPFTYKLLIEQHNHRVIEEQSNPQTAANRMTALRGFMRANGLGLEDIIGHEMRMEFHSAVGRYVRSLEQEGRSSRNISNTRSALRPWKEAVVEHDAIQALNENTPTPFMQMLQSILSGHPIKRVARHAGIPSDMLFGWIKGKVPRISSYKYLVRLEVFFALEKNSLVNISGMKSKGYKVELVEKSNGVPYNELIVKLTSTRYCLKPGPNSRIRQQWKELLQYKTTPVPIYKRAKRGKWRISPCPLTPNSETNWWAFLDGQEIATAKFAWNKTSSILGWLKMPIDSGGAGLPEEQVDTLAWLAVPDYLVKYIEWHSGRVGKVNRGINQLLGLIASLVRPRVGYLRQKHELKATLPSRYESVGWEELCDRQFELTEQLAAAYHKEFQISRDSFAPIRTIIELPQPMDAIVDLIRRMRAARPIFCPALENVWARDLVLIKLLSTLALRRRNMAHLTWREDNTGMLYQRVDKSWWVRVPSSWFKNTHGAAGDETYDCQLHPSAWADIDRYIFIHRPKMLRHPTDLVFLTRLMPGINDKHVPWKELSSRVHDITAQYLPKTNGFGAHAFRHIVATSILKATGGEYKTVAKILNDRVATVEKHYDGLRSNDAATRMGELLAAQFEQM